MACPRPVKLTRPSKHGGEDGHFVPYENIYDGPAIDTQNRLWSLDPFRPWCLFESQGGICKDQACTMHHFRELALTDDAILANLVRQLARVSSPTRFADARQELQALRSRRSTVAEISQALKHIFRAAQLAVRGTSQPLLSDASPTRPFLLTTLHDLFTGKAQRMVRYFQVNNLLRRALACTRTSRLERVPQGTRESQAALEERLAINPRDANLWAELAIEKLQGASYHTMGESGKAIVSDALHVLSRGLQECPKSETLWLYYSELYARFATHQDAQTVIENATSLLPNSVKLRLLLLRSGIEDRDSRRAHFRQLRQLLVDSTKLGMLQGNVLRLVIIDFCRPDDGLKSHVTVDVLMWETQ